MMAVETFNFLILHGPQQKINCLRENLAHTASSNRVRAIGFNPAIDEVLTTDQPTNYYSRVFNHSTNQVPQLQSRSQHPAPSRN